MHSEAGGPATVGLAVQRSSQSFGPFQIVRTLGRGGMGEVFIALTPWSEQPLAAVKRLRPDVARVPTFAERFQHESELAVRLEHENVVGTLDVGSVSGQLYVASELVLGKDTGIVADRLRERGQGGPAAVAIRIMLDVLTGLAYVHHARDHDGTPLALVHRDITPGNLLVSYDGIAKLADFGLAKSHLTKASNLTQHGEILGTPHYLAPELIKGEEASAASDIYGLGAVMYRFLTGVAPHQGTTAEVLLKVLSEEPRSLRDLRPDLSPWLVTFIHALLGKVPAKRPSDARALVGQLGLEAKASGLLVPRSAVGRWLSDLFAEEKASEVEEQNRLIAQRRIKAPQDQSEGTVVLAARSSSGPRLRAPLNDPAESLVLDDVLSAGTDLALEPNAGDATDAQVVPSNGVNGAAAGLDDDSPFAPDGPGLGAAVPSDVTDAAAMLEIHELDAMPTRAVTLQSNFLEFDEESGTHEMISRPVMTPPSVSDAETHFAPLTGDKEDIPTALPGFIEAGAILPSYAPGDTNPEPDELPVARGRPSDGNSVVVAPLGSGAVVRPVPDALIVNGDRRSAASPGRPPRPRVGAKGAPTGRPDPRSPAGRNLLLLAAMLAVAVLLGVFVGALVVSYRNPGVAVVSPRGPLHEQLFRIQTRLVGRVERGEVVPADVWTKVTKAHAALKAGDQTQAAELLRELEAE